MVVNPRGPAPSPELAERSTLLPGSDTDPRVSRQRRPRCSLFRPSQTWASSCLLSLPGAPGEEAHDLELQPTRPGWPVGEGDIALWESGCGLGCPGPEWWEGEWARGSTRPSLGDTLHCGGPSGSEGRPSEK